MAWELLSIHFKQQYETGGYRYLDRCGEFMALVVKKLEAIPSEIVVTGGNFEIPEQGIKCTVNPTQLTVAQQFSPDPNRFFGICQTLEQMVAEYFEPGGTADNGFALRYIWPAQTEAELFKLSLMEFSEAPKALSGIVGMEPWFQGIETHFKSGSRQLHVKINPITFDKSKAQLRIPPAGSSKLQQEKISRQNSRVARESAPAPYAIQIEVDLVEDDPPEGSLGPHFEELKRHTASLLSRISLK